MDNLSEEENKAIEYIKMQIKYFEEQIKFIKATDSDAYDEELEMYENRTKQFNIVLNLIKKQSKIIEEKDKRINKLNIENQIYFEELIRLNRKEVEGKCMY